MPIQVRVKLYLDPDQDDPGGKKITKDKFYFIKISYKSFSNVMANLDKFKNIKIF